MAAMPCRLKRLFGLTLVAIMLCTDRAHAVFDFVTKPGTRNVCVGDDVEFPWRYDDKVYSISMVYWRSLKTGETVLAHHIHPMEEVLTYFPKYENRAILMNVTDANAGFILKDVTKDDDGSYRIELSGPAGADGEATISVYTDDELKPVTIVDNDYVEAGQEVEKYINSKNRNLPVTVTTAKSLTADMTINVGGRPRTCIDKTVCSETIDLNEGSSDSTVNITFVVDYHICKPYQYTIVVRKMEYQSTSGAGQVPFHGVSTTVAPKAASSLGIIVAVIVILIVIGLIAVLVVLCFLWRGKQKKNKELKPYQEKYVKILFRNPKHDVEAPGESHERKALAGESETDGTAKIVPETADGNETSPLVSDEVPSSGNKPVEAETLPPVVVGDTSKQEPLEKTFVPTNEEKRRLLTEYHKDKLEEVKKPWQGLPVTFSSFDKRNEKGFEVKAPQNVLHRAADALQKLIDKVISRQNKVNKSDLLTDDGKKYVQTVESKHSVVIRVDVTTADGLSSPNVPTSSLPPAVDQPSGSYDLGKIKLVLKRGDLTEENVDAVVNSTVGDLLFQGAVAMNILKKGGDSIRDECITLVRRNGKVDRAAMTGAGTLKCNCIIHLNTQNDRTWQERVVDVLALAKDKNVTSVAFPAFGTGKLNPINPSVIAPMMYQAVKEFSERDPGSVKEVSIVIFEEKAKDDFTYHINNVYKGQGQTSQGTSSHTPQVGGYNLGPVCLSIKQGDLTAVRCDAIVNGTNSSLSFVGAVSKALLKKGGTVIQDECEHILNTDGCIQKVAYTSSGDLPCTGILHLDTQYPDEWDDKAYNVLQLAEKKGLASIAFPAFGTGKLNPIPARKMARWMYSGVRKFACTQPNHVKHVTIVAFEQKDKNSFESYTKGLHEIAEEDDGPVGGPVGGPAGGSTDPSKAALVEVYALSKADIDTVMKYINKYKEGDAYSDSLGQWSYVNPAGVKTPYPDDLNELIEAAYQNKDRTVPLEQSDGSYTIHFDTMEEVMDDNDSLRAPVKRD